MKNFFNNIKYKGIFNQLFGVNGNVKEEKAAPRNNLTESLLDNMVVMRQRLDNTADFNVRELTVGGVRMNILTMESMADTSGLQLPMTQLVEFFGDQEGTEPEEIYEYIEQKVLFSSELSDVHTIEDLFRMLMSGFLIILIDGLTKGIVLGAQGFQFRGIEEPSGEINVRGAREGFTEPIKVNMSMVRRRIKTDKLVFESLTLGDDSRTDVSLVYLNDVVSEELLEGIKYKLSRIKAKLVLTTGNLQPFLESDKGSIFSDVGYTERPDTLCYKINEGRVGVLVDGMPFALIVPYLFTENFSSIDDANQKPYYVTMIRILKYIAFSITVFLPGIYVATGMYHPELFPPALLFNILSSQETTPFTMFTEALFIQFVYEVMREAGLRLPRPVGHAIGIIGSLVIGEAAVTAGLIGSPMVMIVALTAISSYVVPTLQEPATLLKFLFIFIGGYSGLYGIALVGSLVLMSACRLTAFGVPYLSPISPYNGYSVRDIIFRFSHKTIQDKRANISELNGVTIKRD